MLVAAAVCPCPPLLVPEVAAGAAPELDVARTACDDALGVLAASRPDLLVVLGPAEQSGRGTHPEGTRGSFSGFGVEEFFARSFFPQGADFQDAGNQGGVHGVAGAVGDHAVTVRSLRAGAPQLTASKDAQRSGWMRTLARGASAVPRESPAVARGSRRRGRADTWRVFR